MSMLTTLRDCNLDRWIYFTTTTLVRGGGHRDSFKVVYMRMMKMTHWFLSNNNINKDYSIT